MAEHVCFPIFYFIIYSRYPPTSRTWVIISLRLLLKGSQGCQINTDKGKAMLIILGQCTNKLTNRLKAKEKHTKLCHDDDVVGLLERIRAPKLHILPSTQLHRRLELHVDKYDPKIRKNEYDLMKIRKEYDLTDPNEESAAPTAAAIKIYTHGLRGSQKNGNGISIQGVGSFHSY